MIYTIGFQGLNADYIAKVLGALDATLVDVRSKRVSRWKPDFNEKRLREKLGDRYEVRPELGGGVSITAADLSRLAGIYGSNRNAVLMCYEAAPGDCHRHHAIAMRIGVEVTHIFGDELVNARELQRSIDEKRDYSCEEFMCA